ncbi:hypothetical protein [uncultured Roseobacter sp.]|uniref:hypothetical protein n=1 Tax=uncultured Roseobacter sp. TaxID=114847 RepID=UPI0026342734|nr:hypothetical protein [uncultured Roseobacter sp.]
MQDHIDWFLDEVLPWHSRARVIRLIGERDGFETLWRGELRRHQELQRLMGKNLPMPPLRSEVTLQEVDYAFGKEVTLRIEVDPKYIKHRMTAADLRRYGDDAFPLMLEAFAVHFHETVVHDIWAEIEEQLVRVARLEARAAR